MTLEEMTVQRDALLAALAVVCVLAWRLSQGPVSLDFATGWIEFANGCRATLASSTACWSATGFPAEIRIHDSIRSINPTRISRHCPDDVGGKIARPTG